MTDIITEADIAWDEPLSAAELDDLEEDWREESRVLGGSARVLRRYGLGLCPLSSLPATSRMGRMMQQWEMS